MRKQLIYPQPGIYYYSYPTFVDIPQQICVHFATPDNQMIFVTYPNRRTYKVAQFLPVSWFDSVNMVRLDGQPQLMYFLEEILPKWLNTSCSKFISASSLPNGLDEYTLNTSQVA